MTYDEMVKAATMRMFGDPAETDRVRMGMETAGVPALLAELEARYAVAEAARKWKAADDAWSAGGPPPTPTLTELRYAVEALGALTPKETQNG